MPDTAFTTADPLEFIDLKAQRRRIGARIDRAIARVLDHGRFILGPEVAELEGRLAAFCGARHAITCASGTDALALGLMAKGVGPGDAVLVPGFTFAATAEVVCWMGATPVLLDVDWDSFNLDPASLTAGLVTARRVGLRPVGVVSVDLFGQPADYDALLPVCEAEGLWLMDDAAQSFGATWRGTRLGTIGAMTATSFFPAKPLGCYGDGGAVFTDDDDLAELIRSLRNHGQGAHKYDVVRIGMNSRLDTIQAAILIEKLAVFEAELDLRQRAADRYADLLGDVALVPRLVPGATSTWAQYTLRLPGHDRGAVARRLADRGIPTAVHYPKPLHRQVAYADRPVGGNGLPVAEKLAACVLSLPMHPDLDDAAITRIATELRAALA